MLFREDLKQQFKLLFSVTVSCREENS